MRSFAVPFAITAALLAGCSSPTTSGTSGGGGGGGGGGGDIKLTRDAAAGAKFNAPGPRSCDAKTQPGSGPISPAQARAYVICGYESADQGMGADQVRLIGHVEVQVSAGRPYEHVRDSLDSIDPARLVYDIRGSSVTYACSPPYDGPALPKPEPCSRTVNQNDEGKCYQTSFGEWKCTWADFSAPMDTDTRHRVPVPSEAEVE